MLVIVENPKKEQSLHYRKGRKVVIKMDTKQFKPTPEMVSAAKAVFMAKALTETIRPIVEGYHWKVLRELQPTDEHTGKVITDIEYDWTMGAVAFQEYWNRCKEEREKVGLRVDNPDYCPLGVARNLQRKAEQALVECMEPITKLKAENALCAGLEIYKKLVDLTLRLLAPFIEA
jgi:hypothetical protein